MQSIEETRAQLEAGWPEALMVSPEELRALRAHDRGMKVLMWATIFAVPLVFVVCVMIVTSLVKRPARESPIYEPYPPSTSPSAYNPPRVGLPKLFEVDRELQRQLGPQGP